MKNKNLIAILFLIIIITLPTMFLLTPQEAVPKTKVLKENTLNLDDDSLFCESPRNITYGKCKIPIVLKNTSYIDNCWYRYNNGSGWTTNFTLTSNGLVFSDLSPIWIEGSYHLQIFANDSLSSVSHIDQWFKVEFGQIGAYWSNTGEIPGAAYAISPIESLNGTIYVGTAWTGNIFKSNDKGETWTNISKGLSGTTAIYSIIETLNGELFTGTRPYGNIFKSTDGGANWVNSSNGINGATRIYSLLELKNGSLLAGSYPYGDVFISHDRGISWHNVSKGLNQVTTISKFLESKNGSIYALTDQGVFISNNGCLSWRSASKGLVGLSSIDSIVQLSNGSLYVPAENSTHCFIGISNDGGANWRLSKSPAKIGSNQIHLIETRNKTLFLTTAFPANVFKTSDGGATWTNITNGIENCNRISHIIELLDGSLIIGTAENGDVFRLPIINYVQIPLSSGISFQDEGTLNYNDTLKLKYKDGIYGPTTTGTVTVSYYATGPSNSYFDAISLNFNALQYDPTFNNAKLIIYLQKGNYALDPTWRHYVLLGGAFNSSYEDMAPGAFAHEIPNIVQWQWLSIPLLDAYWKSGKFDITLRLWNIRVDYIALEILPDADKDGLLDDDETNLYGTDPFNPDSDRDSLTDYDELFRYRTDPNDPNIIEEAGWTYSFPENYNYDASSIDVSDGNAHLTTYLGDTWIELGRPGGPQVIRDIIKTSNGTLYIATNDLSTGHVYFSNNGGDTWIQGSNLPGATHAYALLETSNGSLMVGTGNIYGDVFLTNNGGLNWVNSSSGIIPQLNPFAVTKILEAQNGSFYLGIGSSGANVYISNDDAASWINISGSFCSDEGIFSLIQVDNGSLYISTYNNGDVFVSKDGGVTWNNVSNGLKNTNGLILLEAVNKSLIAINNNPSDVYISNDYGVTWNNITRICKNIDTRKGIFTKDGDLYVTSNSGIFRSKNFGLSWTNISSGLSVLNMLSIYQSADGTLYAGNQLTDPGRIYRLNLIYNQTSPIITPKYSIPADIGNSQWTGFMEISTLNGQQIRHQLSNDDGETWYYWNGSAWSPTVDKWNNASVINSYIWKFPAINKSLLVRSQLLSNGTSTPVLDEIRVNYAVYNSMYQISSLSASSYTIQGENCTINLELANNRSRSVPVNISLSAPGWQTVEYKNISLNVGLNSLNLTITAPEFLIPGICQLRVNISRFGQLIAFNTTNTTLRAAYQISSLSASSYTIQGENCTINLELANNRSRSIPVNISLSAPGWQPVEYRNIILNIGLNPLSLNLTAPEFLAPGIYPICVNISRLGQSIAFNSTNTDLRAAYQISSLSASSYTIQGENCTIQLDLFNNRSRAVPINVTLTGSGFYTISYKNLDLEVGMNSFFLNITAEEFASLGPHSILCTVSRLGQVLFVNSVNTTLLPAYQLSTIVAAMYTIQGENCTIQLDLFNNRSRTEPINVTLTGSSFYDITYKDLNLAIGTNSFSLDITAEEFASLGLHSILCTVSRPGQVIFVNSVNTTLLPAYQLNDLIAALYTVQGENCSIRLELFNNRSRAVPINVTLAESGFRTTTYKNLNLEVGTNSFSLNITAEEFASLDLYSILCTISRMGQDLFTNSINTTLLPAYQFSTLVAALYTIQGENCSINFEFNSNRSKSVSMNITLSAPGWTSVEYRNLSIQQGPNQLKLNIIAPEFITPGIYPINININRIGHLLAQNTTWTELCNAYYFPNLQMPSSLIQNSLDYLTLEVFNNRSFTVEFIVFLNGTGFVTSNRSYSILPNERNLINIPIQFMPTTIYETGARNFSIIISYKGHVLYSYEGTITISISALNVFLGYLLPIFIGIIAGVVSLVTYRHQKEVARKKARALKQRRMQLILDLKEPIELPILSKQLKVSQPEASLLLAELLEGGRGAVKLHGLWDENEQLYVPAAYFEQIKGEIMAGIQDDLASKVMFAKGQLLDKDSVRQITLKSLAKSHKLPVGMMHQIFTDFIDQGKLGGYISEEILRFPLSYGFGVLVHNAQGSNLAPEGVAKNFFDLEKWSKLILKFMAEQQHPPEREEAWRIGIPFEKIDAVLNYANIQIQTEVVPSLVPIEREYFDQLSIKVIQYINQINTKPTFTALVVELGLGVKDAKLIIPYINEVLGMEIRIGGIEK